MAKCSISLSFGPPQSGIQEQLVKEYASRIHRIQAAGQVANCLWLTPVNSSVEAVREQILAELPTACLIPGVQSFAGFADAVISASGQPIRGISPLQSHQLLQRSVATAVENQELNYFAPVAEKPGFLAQLARWIAERKRKDEWAEELRGNVSSGAHGELVLLYREYQRLLARGQLYDSEGRFWAARQILRDDHSRLARRFDLVVVAGFTDFTAAQYDILKLISERTDELRFSFAADADLPNSKPDESRAWLFDRISKTVVQLRTVLPSSEIGPLEPLATQTTTLHEIERSLFRDEHLPASEPADHQLRVSLLAAASDQEELESIAARIKHLLVRGHARPKQVLIVSRALASAAPRIAEVFEDHGVPHWIEHRQSLRHSSVVRSLRRVLQLEIEDWPFRQLLEVVRDRGITMLDGSGEPGLRASLEHAIRAAQLPSGKAQLLSQIQRWAEAGTEVQPQRTHQAASAHNLLDALSAKLAKLPTSATIEVWLAALEELQSDLGMLKTDAQEAEWRVLAEGLRSLEVVDARIHDDVSNIDLSALLGAIGSVASMSVCPGNYDSTGRVRVYSAETARHLTAEHVFLIGLSEQSFSANSRAGELDQDRQRSAEEVASDQADMMYLFYSLVTMATESLTLSYAAIDDKGQQLPASPMIDAVLKCLPQAAQSELISSSSADHSSGGGIGLQDAKAIPDESLLPASRTSQRTIAVQTALDGNPGPLADLMNCQPSLGSSMLAGIGVIASRGKRDEFGAFEGLLPSEKSHRLLGRLFNESHLWSPSQLEQYATCPYQFFASQLLNLDPLPDLTVASDLGRRGSMLHQVLARVHQQLAEQPLQESDEETLRPALIERFRATLTEEVESRPLGGVAHSLREIERREIDAWAEDYAQQELAYRGRWSNLDQPLRPTLFEVRFGPEVTGADEQLRCSHSTTVPFELNLGEQHIRITGQIDRIDIGRVGQVTVFNVIDYKSGKELKFRSEEFIAGRQLQLPLYALAAEELLLADENAVALAAGYWSIRGKGFEKGSLELQSIEGGEPQPTEQSSAMRSQLVETLSQLVAGIQHGDFPVYNPNDKCTSWCSYRTICRIAQVRSLEKHWPIEEEAVAE